MHKSVSWRQWMGSGAIAPCVRSLHDSRFDLLPSRGSNGNSRVYPFVTFEFSKRHFDLLSRGTFSMALLLATFTCVGASGMWDAYWADRNFDNEGHSMAAIVFHLNPICLT